MAVLLVTYEFKTAGKDYSAFFETLKNTPQKWWHYLENVWIVETDLSADAFAKKLYPHFSQDDRVLVTRITSDQQGWLQKEAWEWLNNRKY